MTTKLTTRARAELAKYDPVKGVLKVHAAREAEKRARRARDIEGLSAAIERKLTEQRTFVVWWDTKAERLQNSEIGNGRGRRSARHNAIATKLRPEDFGLSVGILSKWRTRLLDPQRFVETVAVMQEAARRLLECVDTAHVSQNSGENEWYTPAEYTDAARAVMGAIDLDPASTVEANAVVRAARIFTLSDNGLDQSWRGRIWLNPPYGENPLWFREIIRYWDAREIEQLCMLSPAWAFTTNAARPVIARSSAMLLLHPTPKFWGRHREGRIVEQGSEQLGVNHPHLILYMGHSPERFRKAFASFGTPMQLLLDDALPVDSQTSTV